MTDKLRVEVPPDTLSVTHVCDGQEIITGGADGQTYVATFASRLTADMFIDMCRAASAKNIFGDRNE